MPPEDEHHHLLGPETLDTGISEPDKKTEITEVSDIFETKVVKTDAKRICVFADQHGNLAAFNAVLEDMKYREYDYVVCLGDFVGYYTEPDPIITKVREIVDVAIMGNHDFALIEPEDFMYSTLRETARPSIDHNRKVISEENKNWLKSLPFKVRLETPLGSLFLVHGDPVTLFNYIYGETDEEFEQSILEALSYVDTDYLLVGHSHLQGEYYAKNGQIFVNPGAIGQPRDGDNRAAYCIIDLETKTNKLIRVPYDIEKTKTQVVASHLPEYLANRLDLGK